MLKRSIVYVHIGNVSFVQHLPEGGHRRWPKHVGGFRRI